jgi:predicted RND superfamily exporter protein
MQKFFKHPGAIIAVCLVITAFFGFQLKDVKLDNSVKQFLPQKHESYKRLEATKEKFGSMASIGISLETTTKDSIITPEYIAIIQKITDQVKDVKFIDDVTSLTNIDYVYGKDGSLVAGSLIPDEYTGSQDDIDLIKQKLEDWNDMYNRVVISDDGKATQMQLVVHDPSVAEQKKLGMTAAQEQDQALKNVRNIVTEAIKGTDLNMKMYGEPVISEDARTFMMNDLERLIPLVVIVVLLSLFFSFHTLDGTLLPLIAVLMATIWSCGLMALLNITFTIVSSVIPVALIACGSAYGIHVLTHYYIAVDDMKAELDKTNSPWTKEKHLETICKGLKDVWLAVFLAALTTVVGFISLITSPIRPLYSFAAFTAIGIAFSLILSVTLIPALLLTKKVDRIGKRSKHMQKITNKVKNKLAENAAKATANMPNASTEKPSLATTLYNIYHFFAGTKPRLVVFSIAVCIISVVGLKKMVVDTALVSYFPETSRLRQDIDYVDKRFAGSNSVYFLIESPAAQVKKEADALTQQAANLKAAAEKNGGKIDDATQKKIDDITAQASAKYEDLKDTKKYPNMTNPEVLKPLDNMEQYLSEKYDAIGKIVSFGTFIKRMNQVMHVPDLNASAPAPQTASSSGTDDFSSDFGSDFSSDFGSSSAPAAAETAPAKEFTDPNIAYAEMLKKTMTTEQALALLNEAYAEAGGKHATVAQIVKILQEKLNYNGADYYEIPYNPAKYPVGNSAAELSDVVSQYLILFSGSLDRFADDPMSPKVIRTQVQLRNHSTVTTGKVLKDAQDYAKTHFPAGYTLEPTGTGEMEYVMTNLVVSSQMSSLLVSLLSVFIIIAIAFKSAWAGIIGAIPLALTIILNYMVMGFTGIKLDLITSIIASVAIGVGIDYTIHFMTEYRELRQTSSDLDFITRETFRKSGLGIITNALAVGLGFLVLCFSQFIVLRYIGILIAIVMFTSSFLAMTVIPGLFNAFDPKFLRPRAKKDEQ